MAERGKLPEHAGIGEQHVELAPALEDRLAEPVDSRIVLDIERYKRGGAAELADGVVQFLQPADGARHGNHVGAGRREALRSLVADAARSARDDGDSAGKRLRLAHAVSANRVRCRTSPASSWSVSRVG